MRKVLTGIAAAYALAVVISDDPSIAARKLAAGKALAEALATGRRPEEPARAASVILAPWKPLVLQQANKASPRPRHTNPFVLITLLQLKHK